MKNFPGKVILVVLLIVVPSAAGIYFLTASVKSSKSDFHKELAKRLDSEEKLLKAENERTGLASQVESLRDQLAKSKDEIKALKEELKNFKDDVEGERAARLIAEQALVKAAKAKSSVESTAGQAATATP